LFKANLYTVVMTENLEEGYQDQSFCFVFRAVNYTMSITSFGGPSMIYRTTHGMKHSTLSAGELHWWLLIFLGQPNQNNAKICKRKPIDIESKSVVSHINTNGKIMNTQRGEFRVLPIRSYILRA